MAKEMVQYSLSNILAQAGQSMMSQANQSNQGVLSLLRNCHETILPFCLSGFAEASLSPHRVMLIIVFVLHQRSKNLQQRPGDLVEKFFLFDGFISHLHALIERVLKILFYVRYAVVAVEVGRTLKMMI